MYVFLLLPLPHLIRVFMLTLSFFTLPLPVWNLAHTAALRDRLQREVARRQLVEEACENERRRRKLAEDILDDTRRENTAPLVLPAMMDAFERIAQLTGDALMPGQEDMKM